ncbi:MAG: Ribosome maturation factor RimP [Firmicutes bacterium ADurb.Bin080]|nr:MAG: Ribosome maturation factor RimP [Firmicutes bacterium ADurb.Bin080]
MDNNIIVPKIELIVKPILEELSYELVEIKVENRGSETNITIFIYKEEGISFEDCVLVDKELSLPLENADISEGKPYTLIISSPGLDRPIVNNDDFRRNIGVKVDLVTKQNENLKNKIVGFIREYNDTEVSFETTAGKTLVLERANIKTLLPHLDF